MKLVFFPTLAALLIAFTGHAQQQSTTPRTTPSSAPVTATQVAPAPNATLPCQTLTGRVTNNVNEPLTGATVMLRSRSKSFGADACITNAEGEYLLMTKQPIPLNTVLEISAGGYSTFAQPLANCQPMEASLEPLPGTRFKANGRIKKTKASGKIH